MIQPTLILALVSALQTPALPLDQNPEKTVVEYLKANVRPGEPVVVSRLLGEVFTGEPERKALNRLFNTFFKIPLFIVQVQESTGAPPSLKEISDQFAFSVPGQAEVILRIMEADPRMPRFLERDPKSGEILKVATQVIKENPRFGKLLERTVAGWEGRDAPDFAVKAYDGSPLTRTSLAGRPFLLYFWFTNCPPCLETAPHLVELDAVYRPQGFTIVALNADRVLELDYTDTDRRDYAARLKISFALVHANAEAQAAYGGVSVFPTFFFVDKSGVVVRHLVNSHSKTVIEDAIRLALK